MNSPLRSVAGASLALWLGAVLMTGAAAAIAFPAMRDLGPSLAQFPAHPEDHWSIAAGHVMLPVFRVLDITTLALSSLAVICTGMCVRACGRPAAIAVWLVGLIGAGGVGVHHALDRSPHMDALAHEWWAAAESGDQSTAQAKKQAFDDLHPVASAALKAESGLLLLALAGWAFAPLRERTTEEQAPVTADRTPSNPAGLRDLPFEVPRISAAKKKRALQIYEALTERYPDAECALEYSTPHELLIATILSAQSTDVGVNKATPGLFKAFPTPEHYAKATPEKIEPHVKTIGLYRNKSKAVHAAMTTLVEEFGGEVPRDMDDLLTLRGVARKTANVVLGNAFGINMGVVVDTHVDRVSRRFGLVPEGVTLPMAERHLIATFPRDTWTMLSHLLIFHGRQACKARGELCAEDEICKRFCANAKGGTKKPATKKKSSKKTSKKKTTKKKPGR